MCPSIVCEAQVVRFCLFTGAESALIQKDIYGGLQVMFSRYYSLLWTAQVSGMSLQEGASG